LPQGSSPDSSRNQPRRCPLDRRPTQPVAGGEDDRQHRRLDPGNGRQHLRQLTVGHIEPRQGDGDQDRGSDEARAGDYQPCRPAAQEADVDGHFRRIRPGNQVGGPDQIDVLLAGQPLPPLHDLVFHQSQMRRGPAKPKGPELQKQQRDFTQRGSHRGH
jgi:hypothetical protein